VTTVRPLPLATRPRPIRPSVKGATLLGLLQTTDHKVIGMLYLVTSMTFFFIGGSMAMLIRAELARPGLQFLSNEQYNQLFTMHGTIMLLLYATPMVFAFANLVLPLQIGAPDVAFPRLNAFSYWLFLFGGIIVISGFLTPSGAADFGWFAYTPLSEATHSPGAGGDLWITGLVIAGLGTILGAVNMITTVVCLRAPGMTMFRMPILPGTSSSRHFSFCWHSRSSPRRCWGWRPTGGSARMCSTRPTAGPSCGNTCSGSSATPRSTSSRYPSSGSSPR
jgi:cytochrome c oxidase subunit 1